MKFTLDVNMNTETFASFKDAVFKAAKANNKWESFVKSHLASTTPQEWIDKCGYYLGWLGAKGINVKLKGFTYSGGGLYLCGYKFPLPEGFTYCNRELGIEGYKHALPDSLTHCGGILNLNRYEFPLPEGFTYCGGYLLNNFYNYPLPKAFKAKGKY